MDVVNNRRATFKKILNVTSGNFLEQYDFFLFGFYATYIAAKFFHSDNEYVSLMMTFTVFCWFSYASSRRYFLGCLCRQSRSS